jgi:DNA-binding LytR/AlgR family response regulator
MKMKKLRIPIKGGGYRFIWPGSIDYIEVVKRLTTIYLSGEAREKLVTTKSLKYFEDKLKAFDFGRMNQQHVVNHLSIIGQDNLKKPNLILEGCEVKIPLSPAYKLRHGDFYL